MNSIILIITLALYTYQVYKLRKEVKDLKEDISAIDNEFWNDDECEEKI